MRTLIAQAAISICHLVFAVLALRVSRQVPRSQPAFRYVWALTGAAFLIRGANSLFHDAFSTYAYLSGPGSRPWNAVMGWHPVLNHSRTFMLVAYCLVLCVALLRAARRRPLPSLRMSLAFLVAGMLVGGVVGWREESFTGLTHFIAVAMWDMVELLAMMAVLLVGISTASIDRAMWACLGINAFALSLSVLVFAFLSRIDVVGEWAPRTYHIQAFKAVLYTGAIVIVIRQMRRLRQGKIMRSFFDDRAVRSAVPSLHG